MESSLDNYDKPPHGTITKGFIALLRSRDPQVRQVSFLVHVHYLDRRERSLNIQFVRANADLWWWQGYGGADHVAHIEDVLRVQTNECFFDQFKPDRSCPRVDCTPTELGHRLVHAAAFAANHAIMQLFTYYVEEAVTHLYRDPLFRLAMGQHVTTNLCSGMQQLGDNL
jgi:hypothetical protein